MDQERRRIIERKPHTLNPQRWRAIVILTDSPGPGQGHLSVEEIKEEFSKALDLPDGISFEFGAFEKAAAAGSA